jgi:hypothetical protein
MQIKAMLHVAGGRKGVWDIQIKICQLHSSRYMYVEEKRG